MENSETVVPWRVRVPQRLGESEEDWRKRLAVARSTQWAKNNPEKRKAHQKIQDAKRTHEDFKELYWTSGRRGLLKRKYGITPEDYDRMFEEQKGLCAICNNTEKEASNRKYGYTNRLCVDHNHSTGKVRALLCGKCNRAIGNLNDSLDTARSVVSYLERYDSKG